MSGFLQVVNRIASVASEVSRIADQVSGRPALPGSPAPATSSGAMAQDRMQWASPAPVAPPQPPSSPSQGLMGILSTLGARISDFFKRLFGGASTLPASGSAPVAPPPSAGLAPMADAREQLFRMIPTGRATVFGLVSVNVSREADRVRIDAGSFGQAVISKQQGEFYFQQDNKPPIRVKGVASSSNGAGGLRFDITLDSGKQHSMELLADGRTLRYEKYQLQLT